MRRSIEWFEKYFNGFLKTEEILRERLGRYKARRICVADSNADIRSVDVTCSQGSLIGVKLCAWRASRIP